MIENIAFRFDASPSIGMGHLTRCLALAEELKKRNKKCFFLSKTSEKKLIKKIQEADNYYVQIPWDLDLQSDAKYLIEFCELKEIDWVVTDHYEINSNYLKKLKEKKLKILSIDDTARTYYPSDIVLNQNIGAEKLVFSTSKDTQFLLGPKYVLIRSELLKREKKIENNEVKKLLITMGGTNEDNFILRLLESLSSVNENIEFLVISGPFNPFYYEIKRYARETHQKIKLIKSPENIADIYLESDVAISAGGTSCYELAYFGIPNMIITIADNQRNIAYEMDKQNVSISIGDKKEFKAEKVRNKVNELINNHSLRKNMSRNGRKLVDGKGRIRVVDVMERFN